MPTPSPARLIHIKTFGCQMNVNDSDRMLQVLAPHNYEPTEDPSRADVILLNTCSVRDKAEQKMLSELGRLAPLKEYNDQLILGVAGCVAQQEGARLLKKVPYLDLVLGPDHVAELPQVLERVRTSQRRLSETRQLKRRDYRFVEAAPKAPGEQGVTEFVTVMKGCDKVCTYCIVPFTRGREVSKPPEMIAREVERLVAAGVREVTLLGQNVNSYGKDLQRWGDQDIDFARLLDTVDGVEGLERLRFTTSHPMDCTDALIDRFGRLRTLCSYFHLPVQSGSERVLQAMRRHTTREHYMGRIERLRQRDPDIALSTDIIVGFPGETREEFEETLELLQRVQYDSLFAFKYSPRPGTKAADLPDDVPTAEKKRRLAQVFEVQRPITAARMARYAGRTVEVLVEGPSRSTVRGPGASTIQDLSGRAGWQLTGRTRTNVIVNFPLPEGATPLGRVADGGWIGRLVQVKVQEVLAHSLYGELA